MSFTEEEWENYIPPENSWFENEHYFEYYDENYDEGYYNETNAAEDKLYLTATLVTQTEAERYYLTGFVRKDLEASDKYVSYAQLYHLCRKYAYVPPAVEIVSILVWIVCLVYLLVSAGYVRTAEAPQETTFEKIPFDLFSCLTVIAGFILIFGFCVIENYDLPDIAVIASLGIIAALGVLLAVWWLVSLTIRIRTGTILSRNLIVILSRKIHHIFRSIREQLSISWQALIAISGFIFLSFFIALTREPGLYLLLSCAVIIVTLPVLGNLLILEKGLDRLSQGNLEANIPEKLPLFGPFLRYARQLNHVSDSMNKAVGERLKSEMFKTELIANVSHDIRTPLTSIINYTDLLSKLDLQNPEAEEYLEVLTRQSARLRKLTEDVLEASKATTGNIKAELEKLDLRVLLEQVTGEYTERLEKRNLKLLSIIPETPLYLSADGRLMWRVMDNLLGNICKYAMEGSRVYLDVRTENTKIICTLRNMSAQPLNISTEALLERFVRGDRSRNTEGSGLGLSIAKSLTEIQGGKLDLKIDGDLFKVTLEFPEMKIR